MFVTTLAFNSCANRPRAHRVPWMHAGGRRSAGRLDEALRLKEGLHRVPTDVRLVQSKSKYICRSSLSSFMKLQLQDLLPNQFH